jgi:membrane associated rhomboid family serine protease
MKRRLPLLTAITLGATILVTATRLFGDGPLDALRRDPAALGNGQVWRLLSPVLVQSDASVFAVLGVFVLCAVIGAAGERFLSRGRWIALYLAGALAGHGIGEAFQPHQGGTSVAFFGILGGLAAYALLDREPALRMWRVRAAVAVPLAAVDTAVGDIHGVAFLAGLGVAALLVARERTAADPVPAPS